VVEHTGASYLVAVARTQSAAPTGHRFKCSSVEPWTDRRPTFIGPAVVSGVVKKAIFSVGSGPVKKAIQAVGYRAVNMGMGSRAVNMGIGSRAVNMDIGSVGSRAVNIGFRVVRKAIP
jgi:hypothetical protein